MAKCRPGLNSARDTIEAKSEAPGNPRSNLLSRDVTAKYWSRRYDSLAFGADSGEQSFDRHAGLLNDSRLSISVNRIQKAVIVRKLERDYGARYVQRLIEHISDREAVQVRTRIKAGPAADQDRPDHPR